MISDLPASHLEDSVLCCHIYDNESVASATFHPGICWRREELLRCEVRSRETCPPRQASEGPNFVPDYFWHTWGRGMILREKMSEKNILHACSLDPLPPFMFKVKASWEVAVCCQWGKLRHSVVQQGEGKLSLFPCLLNLSSQPLSDCDICFFFKLKGKPTGKCQCCIFKVSFYSKGGKKTLRLF